MIMFLNWVLMKEVDQIQKMKRTGALKDWPCQMNFLGFSVLMKRITGYPSMEPSSTEGTTLQGLDFIENEQSLHSASKFSSFHSETTMGGSTTYFDDAVIPGQIETSEGDLDSDISQLPKPEKEDEYDSSALPCEAWWKRRAASLYAHAKETNAFWSIFIAAAVMGLVIIGQRWQQERWQVLQLKWQFNISDEFSSGELMQLFSTVRHRRRSKKSVRSSKMISSRSSWRSDQSLLEEAIERERVEL
ncbi:hypothetical protein HYC85_009107 [Camellia sinensis]|uniref:Uncharacterized protein n=1 Tax=Camellia sinensis TaxID=4442 RepID=A0A7J7HE34_CAMSI|nr:hypothetical protein HYC85_009107 [Camellia sinensis]